MFFYLTLFFLQNATLNFNPAITIARAEVATTKNPTDTMSYSKRYNLAITYYQQQDFARALAIWRQLFFERPYHLKARQAILHTQEKLSFSNATNNKNLWQLIWIRTAPHIILALLASLWGIFILRLYQRKQILQWLVLVIGMHMVAGYYYFIYEKYSYATLIKPAILKSAPDEAAVILSKNLLAGELLKIKQQTKDWVQVELHSNVGWLPASTIIPLKKSLNARLSPTYSDRVK